MCEPQNATTMERISDDVLRLVGGYLPLFERIAAQRVNKRFRRVFWFWREACQICKRAVPKEEDRIIVSHDGWWRCVGCVPKERVCRYCEVVFPPTADMVEEEGKWECARCMDYHLEIRCDWCGDWYLAGETEYVEEIGWVCPRCAHLKETDSTYLARP